MVKLGDKRVDPDVFSRRFKHKNPTAEPDNNDRLNKDAKNDSSTKTFIKLRNLSKQLRFITEVYFDFNTMMWRDRFEGRALNTSHWYQDNSYHVRHGLTRYGI